jgi:hypothetical protein
MEEQKEQLKKEDPNYVEIETITPELWICVSVNLLAKTP